MNRTIAAVIAAVSLSPYVSAFEQQATRSDAKTTQAAADKPCRIEIVEKGTGWPVPLVELRTTHNLKFVSDNAGVVAVDQPELMGHETWFGVNGNGYQVKKDGFGYRGVRLTPKPGKTLKIEVERTIIAKRLGRITGGGLFAESQQTGKDLDWKEQGIVGCDSVQLATHRGKRHWLWGDTSLLRYPLGIFHMSGATTKRKPIKDFKPPVRLRYDYYKDTKTGRPRGVAKMPGSGPTWLGGFVSLPDKNGEPHLVATYAKIKPPLSVYERGLCVWNEKANRFDRLRVISQDEKSSRNAVIPNGHPVFWKDKAGKRWVLFGDPLPTLRCPATFEAWRDPKTWEKLTPQKTLRSADGVVGRIGNPSHKKVEPHSGSIAWHPHRKRWVTVFMQRFGQPSTFGELWYAEADSPTGPWGPAVKVLSHKNYTFYNPRIHDEWFDAKSPVLIFEGTYTRTFANNPPATPRYDYNQILYRLDLDDEKLKAARE